MWHTSSQSRLIMTYQQPIGLIMIFYSYTVYIHDHWHWLNTWCKYSRVHKQPMRLIKYLLSTFIFIANEIDRIFTYVYVCSHSNWSRRSLQQFSRCANKHNSGSSEVLQCDAVSITCTGTQRSWQLVSPLGCMCYSCRDNYHNYRYHLLLLLAISG